ncbi:MAG: ATP-dependent DNA ligase [Armatimonadota bacterium]|nr:ATP-dependent DNA ligase [Armatimonadota bacterium]
MTQDLKVSSSGSFDPAAPLFGRFASTADSIGCTAKRLEKAALLATYFSALTDEDLSRAARFFAGYAFPLRDQRTIQVGGAALLSAIHRVTGVDDTTLRERLVVLGDVGDLALEAFGAVEVAAPEDHPLTLTGLAAALEELASTPGRDRKVERIISLIGTASPLEAKYLVRLLAADLRIGLQEGAVEDAIARWAGVAVGRVQWTNMLLGDVGETAVLARHGRLDEAQMRLFHPLKFMLATPAADLAEVASGMPDEFNVEDKFDGIRAQVHLQSGLHTAVPLHGTDTGGVRVALFSRTLDEITESFPDLVEPLARLLPEGSSGGLVLDGEIVPVKGDVILPFGELQKRLGRKTLPDELRRSVPTAFVAYDILYDGNSITIDQPFIERRRLLESLPFQEPAVRLAASTVFGDAMALDAEFTQARLRGNEGLMVKDPASPYKPGRRGRSWLKIKRALAALDVVVTSVEVGNGKRRNLLSDYTFAVRASDTDNTLLNIGKAYSGLTDAELAELSEWFRLHTVQEFAHGKVRVVEPKIVVEITFDAVQESKRHKSGYALRFPRILRLRPDKPAEEIDTLEMVQKLVKGKEF